MKLKPEIGCVGAVSLKLFFQQPQIVLLKISAINVLEKKICLAMHLLGAIQKKVRDFGMTYQMNGV